MTKLIRKNLNPAKGSLMLASDGNKYLYPEEMKHAYDSIDWQTMNQELDRITRAMNDWSAEQGYNTKYQKAIKWDPNTKKYIASAEPIKKDTNSPGSGSMVYTWKETGVPVLNAIGNAYTGIMNRPVNAPVLGLGGRPVYSYDTGTPATHITTPSAELEKGMLVASIPAAATSVATMGWLPTITIYGSGYVGSQIGGNIGKQAAEYMGVNDNAKKLLSDTGTLIGAGVGAKAGTQALDIAGQRLNTAVYNNLVPAGYGDMPELVPRSQQIKGIIKDFLFEPHLKDNPKYLGLIKKSFKNRAEAQKQIGEVLSNDAITKKGEIALELSDFYEKARLEAYRIYLGKKPQTDIFVSTGNTVNGIPEYTLNPKYMTFNSKSLYANQIEVESGRTPGEQVVIGDALSGVGGNVAGKAVKTGNTIQGNPELEFQLRDVWDVLPFLDPGRTSIIPKWMLEKEINQYVGNSKYKKWVPDWFKNLEMSQLIPGARPWILNTTFRGVGVPVTSSPPIERINTLNKVRRATGLPAISIN